MEPEGDIEVVGDIEPGGETLSVLERLVPDVAMVDMRWPAEDGLALCREIRKRLPGTAVVMVSSTELEEETVISILVGASGCVSAEAPGSELIRTIRIAAEGGTTFGREASDRVLGRLRHLTEVSDEPDPSVLTVREREVLSMLARGATNDEIGAGLRITAPTARNHITRIRTKLDIHSRTELAAYALRHGIVDSRSGGGGTPDAAS